MEILSGLAQIGFAVALLLLLIFFVLYLLASIISAFSRVPFVGSKQRKIRTIIAQVNPSPGARFYDLGSGDGRIVFLAAEKFGLHATGIEFNPILILFCSIKRRILRAKHARFIRANILQHEYSNADIIYVFLFPHLLEALAPKFMAECKKGTVIISHGFEIVPMSQKLYKTVEDQPFSTYYYHL